MGWWVGRWVLGELWMSLWVGSVLVVGGVRV